MSSKEEESPKPGFYRVRTANPLQDADATPQVLDSPTETKKLKGRLLR